MGGILAGGLSRRMGGVEKSFIELDGIPLINRVIGRLEPQVANVVINANGDPDRFNQIDYPIVSDIIGGFAGPLAGIHALLNFAADNHPDITHVATVAADTPFFPIDFVESCACSIVNSSHNGNKLDDTIVMAKSSQNRHPTFGLWPVALCEPLAEFLTSGDTRKVMVFVQSQAYKYVEFSYHQADNYEIDPFFNINEPNDLEKAHRIANLPIFSGQD